MEGQQVDHADRCELNLNRLGQQVSIADETPGHSVCCGEYLLPVQLVACTRELISPLIVIIDYRSMGPSSNYYVFYKERARKGSVYRPTSFL
jgi:hypothetical protein